MRIAKEADMALKNKLHSHTPAGFEIPTYTPKKHAHHNNF